MFSYSMPPFSMRPKILQVSGEALSLLTVYGIMDLHLGCSQALVLLGF